MVVHQKWYTRTLREQLLAQAARLRSSKAQVEKNPAKLPENRLQANRRATEATERPEALKPEEGGGLYSAELRAMRDAAFCRSERYKDQQARANRAGADLDIVEFEKRLVTRMAKIGVPMFAHCVKRSDDDQNALFVLGHSKAKAGQSPHNVPHVAAVDIVHGIKAWDLSRSQWELIGHIGYEVARSLGVDMTWGGDWKFYDPAHWEIANWKVRSACEHSYQRRRRGADETSELVSVERCVHCGFRGRT
ncbi:hypothetical protein [Flyfo microvirus Tbat2_110]|nr:hypothetical protein [Flyfo microvirus Tbat2_110]